MSLFGIIAGVAAVLAIFLTALLIVVCVVIARVSDAIHGRRGSRGPAASRQAPGRQRPAAPRNGQRPAPPRNGPGNGPRRPAPPRNGPQRPPAPYSDGYSDYGGRVPVSSRRDNG
jgi:predicted lipid-binding transport protein (Tim44 family)